MGDSRPPQTRSHAIYPRPGRGAGKAAWRPEPKSAAKGWDELRVGAKDQSGMEIAGTPRNSFRASAPCSAAEVKRWMDAGPSLGAKSNQTQNAAAPERGSQAAADKGRGREGNSPERQPRPQRRAEWERRSGCRDSQEVGSEAATP